MCPFLQYRYTESMDEQTQHSPIAMIGAGSWGTALALVLARNGQTVFLWGHDAQEMEHIAQTKCNQKYLPDFPLPENIQVVTELQTALSQVRDIFVVVPSHAFRTVLTQLQPFLHANARVAWGTKGLDSETGFCLDQVAKEVLGDTVPLAVLSGPSFASLVAKGLPAAVTVASENEQFADDLICRFQNKTFRLYKSKDILGVELCGAYKNVLAVATGISDGLQFGANARSALITRGVAELSRLITCCGGSKETLLGLAGIGDILLTCTTDASRNHQLGFLIGQGENVTTALHKIGQVAEGYFSTKQLQGLMQQHAVDMPIAEQVYHVLYENLSPVQAAQELLIRDNKMKWE